MFIEAIKALIIGLVEGVTEWLPISSTGHMILVDEFIKLDVSPEFLALFLVIIQIGSIMAVIITFFHKLNPFSRTKSPDEQRGTWRLWGMVVIGSIPAAVLGILLDDIMHELFYSAWTVAAMLILYGIIFIIIEYRNRRRERAAMEADVPLGKHAKVMTPEEAHDSLFKVTDTDQIDWKLALKMGFFQCLAMVPGTSRSGATIIGGMLCGCNRTTAAEFAFFLAIPVMFGWGLVRAVKYFLSGLVMSSTEIVVLVVGIVSAFAMGMVAIRFLMGYIKKNDFTPFGIYRIVLGVIVLAFFGAQSLGLFV